MAVTDRADMVHPDIDGPAGWRMVAAAFLAMFSVFAVHYSFVTFFRAMADDFDASRGATALFFALTNCLYFLLSVVTGRVCDRIGPRPVALTGAVALFLGLVATSFVEKIWIGYLTYAIGVGIAAACCYVPMVAVVGRWFNARRSLALGAAVAGIGAGTIVGAPISEWLIADYGWRVTFRILAVGASTLILIAAFIAQAAPVAVDAAAPAPVWQTIRGHRDFWILWGAGFVLVLALFVPFVYLSDYVETEGVNGSAAWLVGAIGVSSVVGRLLLGALAAKRSVFALYRLSFLALSLSFLIWVFAGSSWGALLVFSLVMGAAYGGFIALGPAVIAEIFGAEGLGGLLGALYTSAGVGGLIGSPLAGVLIDSFGYRTTLIVTLCTALTATAMLTFIKSPDHR